MSKIGKQPIAITSGIEASIKDGICTLKSTLGELSYPIHNNLNCKLEDNQIFIEKLGTSKFAKQMWGTTRALLANAIKGLSTPWEIRLEVRGIGYKVKIENDKLHFAIGRTPFYHQVAKDVKFSCPTATQIVLSSSDKQRVGQEASIIKSYKKPDLYKGYGIREIGEKVRIKQVTKK